MKTLEELAAEARNEVLVEIRDLALQVRAEVHADRWVLALLIASLHKQGVIDGRALAVALKAKSADESDFRGDRKMLFVTGHMVEEFLQDLDMEAPRLN